ncbi:hypothetical protein ACIHDR_47640 [Nocardia sp. NPDC052278]|uniref:hypothetical protein n=1 Tax=unclassified Nocardia TaxID=2637762 RepID=UPI0036A6ABFE
MGNAGFEPTTNGWYPAGTDIAAVLRGGIERDLFAVWRTYQQRCALLEVMADPALVNNSDPNTARRVWHDQLDALAEVTPAQALQANRRITDSLAGKRVTVIQAAREAGDSWTAIGTALGLTKQGAMDWYRRNANIERAAAPTHLIAKTNSAQRTPREPLRYASNDGADAM